MHIKNKVIIACTMQQRERRRKHAHAQNSKNKINKWIEILYISFYFPCFYVKSMARKFTFKKTAELSTNIRLPENIDNETTATTAPSSALISSLETATSTPSYGKKTTTKKQPPPNIFEQQPLNSSVKSSLPFKKQFVNNNNNNNNLKQSPPQVVNSRATSPPMPQPVPPPPAKTSTTPLSKPGQPTLKKFFEFKHQSPAAASPTSLKYHQKENSPAKRPVAAVVPHKKLEFLYIF